MTPRVILVVADPGDVGGRAAARAAALPPSPIAGQAFSVRLVTGDDLAAADWSQHVDAEGHASTTLTLPDLDRPLSDDDLAAVCFRSRRWAVPEPLRAAAPGDVAYARAELTALLVSWLHSLGPRSVNRVEGGSPCGPAWSPARWRQLTAEAGLATDTRRSVAVRSVLVAGAQALGPTGPAEAAACRSLAAGAGCRLLEVFFTAEDAACGVDPVPMLSGPDRIAAAADLLREVAA